MPAARPRESPYWPCSPIRRSRSPSPKDCSQGSKLWQAYLQKGQALYNQGLDGTPDSLSKTSKYLAQKSGQLPAAAVLFPYTASQRAASSGADHMQMSQCPRSTSEGSTGRSQGLGLFSSANEKQAGPGVNASPLHSASMDPVPQIARDASLWDSPCRHTHSQQDKVPGALPTAGGTDTSGDVRDGSSSSSSSSSNCAG